MAGNDEETFNALYRARVRMLRLARGFTSEQMSHALGISHERYRKYESRSQLPLFLVERFAQIVGRDIRYVVTGRK